MEGLEELRRSRIDDAWPSSSYAAHVSETAFCFIDDIQFPKLAAERGLPADQAFGFAAYVIGAEGLRVLLADFAGAKENAGLQPEGSR